MATHSSILAWRIPGSGGPGGLQSWTRLSDTHTHDLGQRMKDGRMAQRGVSGGRIQGDGCGTWERQAEAGLRNGGRDLKVTASEKTQHCSHLLKSWGRSNRRNRSGAGAAQRP